MSDIFSSPRTASTSSLKPSHITASPIPPYFLHFFSALLHFASRCLTLPCRTIVLPHLISPLLISPRLTSSHLDAPFRLVVRCLVLPDIILSCFGRLVRYSLTLPGFIPCNFALILKGSDQKAQKNANASVVYVRFM